MPTGPGGGAEGGLSKKPTSQAGKLTQGLSPEQVEQVKNGKIVKAYWEKVGAEPAPEGEKATQVTAVMDDKLKMVAETEGMPDGALLKFSIFTYGQKPEDAFTVLESGITANRAEAEWTCDLNRDAALVFEVASDFTSKQATTQVTYHVEAPSDLETEAGAMPHGEKGKDLTGAAAKEGPGGRRGPGAADEKKAGKGVELGEEEEVSDLETESSQAPHQKKKGGMGGVTAAAGVLAGLAGLGMGLDRLRSTARRGKEVADREKKKREERKKKEEEERKKREETLGQKPGQPGQAGKPGEAGQQPPATPKT